MACVGAPPPPEPDALVCDVSWDGFAEPVLTTWCTPCHASTLPEVDRRGAPLGLDFDTWEGAVAWADAIAGAVDPAAPRMPPGGGLTDQDRERLVRWVDCGAPGAPSEADPCAERIPHDGDPLSTCAAGANTVAGDLVIDADPGTALDCVCGVDGDLVLTGSARAVTLPRLQQFGGELRADAAGLGTLGLPALGRTGGMSLVGVPLADLSLDELVTVSGDLRAAGGRLPASFGPQRLQTVTGDLLLQGVAGVVAIDLPRLESVGGDFVADGLPDLEQVLHTSDLLTVGGSLRLVNDPRLAATEDFAYLTTIGGDLELGGGGAQTRIDAFWNLETIGGDLVIRDEPALEELTSFLHLLTVMGTVDLRGLGIEQIKGFDDIDQIGALRIVENPSLSDWRGGDVSRVRGDVTIAANEVLNELPLLDGVTTIDGALALTDLPSLVSARGLQSLGEIGGSLTMSRDPVLEEFRLPALARIGGDLVLEQDVVLADLSGFTGLRDVRGDAVIRGNTALPRAEIEQLLGRIDVQGTTTVEGNGP